MDNVKCAVVVSQITEHPNWWKRQSPYKGNAKTIHLGGVMADDKTLPPELQEEARKFYDASPSIDFKLGTVNPSAASFFEVEGIYEVTFRRIGSRQQVE